MNFATWSIRNPIPAILLFVLLTVAGLMGFHKLPIQNLPDIDLPTVNVTLTQPGAAPAQLETEVARRVENSLATVAGLKHLYTSITDGQVVITAEFVLEKNLSDALIDTKNAVDSVRSQLPTDLQQPTVASVTVGGEPVVVYAISAKNMDEEALSWYVDDSVGKYILAVPGVGRLDRIGGLTRQVRVAADPVRMAAQGVTAVDLSQALRNMQQESSGGRGQFGREEQYARVISTVRQASELAAFPLTVMPAPSGPRLHYWMASLWSVSKCFVPRAMTKPRSKNTWARRWSACRQAIRHSALPGYRVRLAIPANNTVAHSTCSTKVRSWRCWWSGGFCATGALPWSQPRPCRCRFCRPSLPCRGLDFP